MKTYSNETGHTVSRSGIRSISQMCGYDRARGPQRLTRAGISTVSFAGGLEITRLLLDHGAKVDAVDDEGNTPLHDVLQSWHHSEDACVSIARLLLERGGDVNAPNKQQRTPLHVVSFDVKFEIPRLLLDHGAKVDAVDNQGNTPLHGVLLRSWYLSGD